VRAGNLRIKLAREFGFCYGVDRAVDYAYQTRQRFPERTVFLSGEIIHNPDVNTRLQRMGVRILSEAQRPEERYADVDRDAVVILPAFGVTVPEMELLRAKGCVLVDTTCGSVLNVWKKVHHCARDGYTVVIHGKHYHEETRATASQALTHAGGHYICVRNEEEAQVLCDFVRGRESAAAFRARFATDAVSPGFDPARHLERIGLANQTTMLMSETLRIQEMLRSAVLDRYGASELEHRFRAFDTICSATQDRQDAVREMLDEGGIDLMVVIGGYNSSNTQALTRMCGARLVTYHIDSPECVEGETIRHRPVGQGSDRQQADWLPPGQVSVGLTAGASTPDSIVGEVVDRLLAARGFTAADLQRVE
jgi:4-hydroxy-3-methylbut-2-enyl diphosphate reductase